MRTDSLGSPGLGGGQDVGCSGDCSTSSVGTGRTGYGLRSSGPRPPSGCTTRHGPGHRRGGRTTPTGTGPGPVRSPHVPSRPERWGETRVDDWGVGGPRVTPGPEPQCRRVLPRRSGTSTPTGTPEGTSGHSTSKPLYLPRGRISPFGGRGRGRFSRTVSPPTVHLGLESWGRVGDTGTNGKEAWGGI